MERGIVFPEVSHGQVYSAIPNAAGGQVKTDRRNAVDLARPLRSRDLTRVAGAGGRG
jgi:hypothetical protein